MKRTSAKSIRTQIQIAFALAGAAFILLVAPPYGLICGLLLAAIGLWIAGQVFSRVATPEEVEDDRARRKKSSDRS